MSQELTLVMRFHLEVLRLGPVLGKIVGGMKLVLIFITQLPSIFRLFASKLPVPGRKNDNGLCLLLLLLFLKKFIYLCIQFWLRWVFLAVRGPSLSCREQGLLFIAVHGLFIAVASLVAEYGLQARGLQQLWHVGSVVVARGLQSTGTVVVVHGLSCSVACGIFPEPGLEPMSPALAGRFLTTAPPGKSPAFYY